MANKWNKENFENYHKQNPQIYAAFCSFVRRRSDKIRNNRFSAKAVFHIIRWFTPITDDQPQFKVDDGWISHYARLFMDEHPDYEGLFETRIRRGGYHEPVPPLPEITEQARMPL